MNFNEPKKYMAEINVVPLVDVVLVLLIIFMVTAPLLYRGIALKLPKSEVNSIKSEEGKTVSVLKDRQIYLDSRIVSLRELERSLTSLKDKNPDVNLFLRADRDVPYGIVVQVMDIIKKAGIERLGMVTESENMIPKP
ncbi:MAG: biopolymer transporter ExbD [Nitrospirae bacterium]|nr:biopolymer transporter ExbD [Nitrospirota bacterium]MBI3593332.1 biopolymer transporter ExbD [Nitrospirota bacterium]